VSVPLTSLLRSYQSISPGPRLSVWKFRNNIGFYGEELLAPRPTPSWRISPCRLSATAYAIYSQLPFIMVTVPPPSYFSSLWEYFVWMACKTMRYILNISSAYRFVSQTLNLGLQCSSVAMNEWQNGREYDSGWSLIGAAYPLTQ